MYNHIQLSSNLISGWDYTLFKPMWEDKRNKRGGRWLITLSKQQRRADLDRFWLETVGVEGQVRRATQVIIGYQSHKDTATKSGSTTKNMFVV
ncbi:unnamed protein product [Coregonus sp. 'balchen']|nr:unnamed protein product [Coregonus sp. 'balchen']